MEYVVPNPFLPKSGSKTQDKIIIYDRTLRGIPQVLGAYCYEGQHCEVAKRLDEIGVDVIEAGVPFLSPKDCSGVKEIVDLGLKAKIAALARTRLEDVKLANAIGVDRIHTYQAISDYHMSNLTQLSRDETIAISVDTVKAIKDMGLECEFTLRDVMNSDLSFLAEIVGALENSGTDVINIPDTVGIATPSSVSSFIEIMTSLTSIPISLHFHNDFGLAVANLCVGVENGAVQLHSALLGLSERSGMAPLEELSVSLKQLYGQSMNIDFQKLYETTIWLSESCGIPIAQHKPIIGKNSFSYEIGPYMHSNTSRMVQYEPFPPVLLGRGREEKAKGF